jgi:hypothetical protein
MDEYKGDAHGGPDQVFDQDADEREPRTIDGEVLPIRMAFGEQAPKQDNALAEAIANHFGVPVENISGFVACVEYGNEQGITLSSVWSLGVPAWRLRGFATELAKHLEQLDSQAG